MFKISQEIRLNSSSSSNGGGRSNSVIDTLARRHSNYNNNNTNAKSSDSESGDCIFGKYTRKTPDADEYPSTDHRVFVAPELTDPSKVQLLHFPNNAVRIDSDVNFIIKRHGTKGNFEVKMESPTGRSQYVPLQILDPERLAVNFHLTEAGLYKVHVKCNSVKLPKSPFIIVSISGVGGGSGGGDSADTEQARMQMPIFKSDASKVLCRGFGLSHICLNEKNEFTVDGSEAGNNILFVGIFGPNGQCDEVVIKHLGRNVYNVCYRVRDAGDYYLAAKWGDEHIPGSPFSLSAI